ncbi:MAG: SMC-Scp complex subunit ScpB [Chloroflexota bacterium]|nr:SMC-Scp complex subunit ScpB [Chloroflexota bacterium]
MSDHEQAPGPSPPSPPRQPALPLGVGHDPPAGPELAALIEALLLVANEPPTIDQLARAAGVPVAEVDAVIARMISADDRGWVLLRHQQTVQLATAPRFAEPIRRFLGLERETRLSGAALETLAIVAYRQPVTRAEIEAVRGVDCAGVLSTLHGRGLIEAAGRLETVGHPIQYGTTPDFLRHFGLQALADLPPLGDVEGRDARILLEAAMVHADQAEGATD